MDKAYMARREGTTAHQLLQLADQNLGAVKANLFHLAALPVFRPPPDPLPPSFPQ